MKKSLKTEILDWIKIISVIFIIGLFATNFLIVNAEIPTGSMRQTIMEGDRVIAFRLAYMFSDPSRFDIIIFRSPHNEKELHIKRIIGLPGETVEIVNGEVFINGESIKHLETHVVEEIPIGSFGPVLIAEDSFFMLGDYRNDSLDSRFWKAPYLNRENIVGRAIFQYFPRIRMLQ